MLSLEGVGVRYGGLSALAEISLHVEPGELVAVVGANGAGKTTLFKAISGVVPLASGRITFEGRDLVGLPAARRPHLGIAHVPEYRQVFGSLSVRENLQLGTTALAGRGEAGRNLDHALDLFPILRERLDQPAGTLSGGQQQMLAIGRGLVASPRLLLLDEPSMGLAPAVVTQIFDRIAQIHAESTMAIVLVEQRAAEALRLCDRAYVMSTGRLVGSGSGAELLHGEHVRSAYLGR